LNYTASHEDAPPQSKEDIMKDEHSAHTPVYKPISVAQMIEVDRLMTEEYGIGLLQMMENAGRSLGELSRRLLGGNADGRKIVVLVGKGNNGGGGMVAARHLANAGARIALALSAAPAELGAVPEHQLRILRKMGVDGADRTASPEDLPDLVSSADLVIDALIGYSLHGAPREPVASFIRAANSRGSRDKPLALNEANGEVGLPAKPGTAGSGVHIVALDIPSGLSGDTGGAYEPCVRAQATLTLAWPKIGLLKETAKPYVGDLYLADISVPAAVYEALGVKPGPLFSEGAIVTVREAGDGWKVIPWR
jgi:NAD(P)H-hydrate epimerase